MHFPPSWSQRWYAITIMGIAHHQTMREIPMMVAEPNKDSGVLLNNFEEPDLYPGGCCKQSRAYV